ncbi:hypothetical protein Xekk_04478 [Xenorhabdus sp. KK7.4]|nr:hypothetical protein Xekk_04478 [Xenorhabdus sp. KK7.4]
MINPAVLIERQPPAGRPHRQSIACFVAIGANPVSMGNNAGDFTLQPVPVKHLQHRFLHQQ